MNKLVKIVAIAVVVVLIAHSAAYAQEPAPPTGAGSGVGNAPGTWNDGFSTGFAGAIGAGLVTIGAAMGIGRLASAALESMARQPEVAGNIQTAMIIAAALIEGFTFFALYICMEQNPWRQLLAG